MMSCSLELIEIRFSSELWYYVRQYVWVIVIINSCHKIKLILLWRLVGWFVWSRWLKNMVYGKVVLIYQLRQCTRPCHLTPPSLLVSISMLLAAQEGSSFRSKLTLHMCCVGKLLSVQLEQVNEHFYIEVLIMLCERVMRRWSKLWKNKSWALHQDNAPVHNALSVKKFVAKHEILVLGYPSYLWYFAPCYFFLFPKRKSVLKGPKFWDNRSFKRKTAKTMNLLSKNDFQHCFYQGMV